MLVGDVMTDVCLMTAERRLVSRCLAPDGVRATSLTSWRRSTAPRTPTTLSDSPPSWHRSEAIDVPVLLLAHPRLRARAKAAGTSLDQGVITVAEPLAYPAMVAVVAASAGVVTDSGGLQKEAFLLGVPCTTVRTETEWPETLVGGWNVLDVDAASLGRVAHRQPPTVSRGTHTARATQLDSPADALLAPR